MFSLHPFNLVVTTMGFLPPALRCSARSAAADGKVYKRPDEVLAQLSSEALRPNDLGSFSDVTQVGWTLPASTNNLIMVNQLPFAIELRTKSVRVN